jgi:hypothetical protein
VEKIGQTPIACAERARDKTLPLSAPGSVVAVSASSYSNYKLSVKRLKSFVNHDKATAENLPQSDRRPFPKCWGCGAARNSWVTVSGHSKSSRHLSAHSAIRQSAKRCDPITGKFCSLSEVYTKATWMSNAVTGFRAASLWPISRSILEMTLFPAEIRTRLMTFIIKKHQAAVHHGLQQYREWTRDGTTVPQYPALHQQRNESESVIHRSFQNAEIQRWDLRCRYYEEHFFRCLTFSFS